MNYFPYFTFKQVLLYPGEGQINGEDLHKQNSDVGHQLR